MTDVLDLARDGLVLAIALILPFVAAAVAGSVVAGLLTQLTGLQDQSVAALARAAAVLVGLWLVAASLGDQMIAFTGDAWSGLAAIGG